jgi:hypothetical protein
MAPERASNTNGWNNALAVSLLAVLCPPLPFPVAPKPLAHADHQRNTMEVFVNGACPSSASRQLSERSCASCIPANNPTARWTSTDQPTSRLADVQYLAIEFIELLQELFLSEFVQER